MAVLPGVAYLAEGVLQQLTELEDVRADIGAQLPVIEVPGVDAGLPLSIVLTAVFWTFLYTLYLGFEEEGPAGVFAYAGIAAASVGAAFVVMMLMPPLQ